MATSEMNDFDKIIVLDFGSQYNQLITRRIREFGVYSELLSHKTTAAEIKKIAPKGIIFSRELFSLAAQIVCTMMAHSGSIRKSLI